MTTLTLQQPTDDFLKNFINNDQNFLLIKTVNHKNLLLRYHKNKTTIKNILKTLFDKVKYRLRKGSSSDNLDKSDDFILKYKDTYLTDENKKIEEYGINPEERMNTIFLTLKSDKSNYNYGSIEEIVEKLNKRRTENNYNTYYVKTLTGKTITVKMPYDAKMYELGALIEFDEDTPVDLQRIIYSGYQCPSLDMTIIDFLSQAGKKESDKDYNEATLHLVLRLMGGMYHEFSGRNGSYENLDSIESLIYDVDYDEDKSWDEYPPSKEKLLKMLQKEEEIRMSKEYSDKCTLVKDEVNGWLRITGELQQKIAYDFGYKDELKNMLVVDMIRRASILYPNDERFQKTQVYVRNNKAKDCFKLNESILNLNIYDLKKNKIPLYDILNSEKSNVIIASSETWQPFRGIINLLQDDLLKSYQKTANIFIIYINEAHAVDEWPIGESAGVINYKHKILEDRIKCAQNLKDRYNYKIPIYVDNMKDEFQDSYSCWPFRCLIIEKKVIKYISKPSNSEYDVMEIYNYLKNKKWLWMIW